MRGKHEPTVYKVYSILYRNSRNKGVNYVINTDVNQIDFDFDEDNFLCSTTAQLQLNYTTIEQSKNGAW